ncbi:hypothetical protein MesoLj131c_65890 (plasmid) [Mesorhizobium sp. 131-3-5]|nr:hypothetical protein MesoLj131c_65890 [Mesorhizobium sp. 131-3-5]
MKSDKPLPITKHMVWRAYKLVEGNGEAAGVDGQSLSDFARDLENNLYKLWNRMASGSYFPPAVRRVEIPKAGGGVRPLGIPTDRGPRRADGDQAASGAGAGSSVRSGFLRLSAGKSAHQAVEQARKRCWEHDWVLDLDIKGFLDRLS